MIVPVLWFGGDWLGSGSPWNGADVAQVARGSDVDPVRARRHAGVEHGRRARSGWRLVIGVVVLAWRRQWTPLVAGGDRRRVVGGRHRHVRRVAATPRWAASTSSRPRCSCVVAGIGFAELVAGVRRRSRVMVAAAAVLAVSLPLAWPRVRVIDNRFEDMRARSRFERDLDPAIAAAGGRDADPRLWPGGASRTATWPTPSRPALAWKLDLPLSAGGPVRSSRRPGVVPRPDRVARSTRRSPPRPARPGRSAGPRHGRCTPLTADRSDVTTLSVVVPATDAPGRPRAVPGGAAGRPRRTRRGRSSSTDPRSCSAAGARNTGVGPGVRRRGRVRRRRRRCPPRRLHAASARRFADDAGAGRRVRLLRRRARRARPRVGVPQPAAPPRPPPGRRPGRDVLDRARRGAPRRLPRRRRVRRGALSAPVGRGHRPR